MLAVQVVSAANDCQKLILNDVSVRVRDDCDQVVQEEDYENEHLNDEDGPDDCDVEGGLLFVISLCVARHPVVVSRRHKVSDAGAHGRQVADCPVRDECVVVVQCVVELSVGVIWILDCVVTTIVHRGAKDMKGDCKEDLKQDE